MNYVNQSENATEKTNSLDGNLDFERLSTLIEAFQFYPMIVKKDRNKSSNIQ